MINTVFSAFNFKPASLDNWTSLSNNVIISEENIANINCALHGLPAGIQVSLHFTSLHLTSSANVKSKSGGKPSPRSNPNEHVSAHVRHFKIAQ